MITRTTTFSGLLAGLQPGHLQTRGLMDVVALLPAPGRDTYTRFVSPLENLKLVRVPTYGTLILHNAARQGVVIAPMHIGFFQVGAQNHATSRVLILQADETSQVTDCFCIQQSQGGLLKEAQQRFIILPLHLRKMALAKRGKDGFSRLWGDIDSTNRRYGIARGGHLERFLRPYFHRMLPFRHAFEAVPRQVGAAYYVAGRLVGVEVAPNPAYWQEISPILNIYCYGAAALLGERQQLKSTRPALDLQNLATLDDLAMRLEKSREQAERERTQVLEELSRQAWNLSTDATEHGLSIIYLAHGDWVGQMVRSGPDMIYLSIFRDLTTA